MSASVERGERVERHEAVARWEGFVLVDADGRIVLYNSGSPRLYHSSEQAEYALRSAPGSALLPVVLRRGGIAEVLGLPRGSDDGRRLEARRA